MSLIKCWHCGGEATTEREVNMISETLGKSLYRVKCLNCGIATPYTEKEKAITIWNGTRATRTNLDFIQTASSKDLAKFISGEFYANGCCYIKVKSRCTEYDSCAKCTQAWLERRIDDTE